MDIFVLLPKNPIRKKKKSGPYSSSLGVKPTKKKKRYEWKDICVKK